MFLEKLVKCDQCDFAGETEAGQKSHKTKKRNEKVIGNNQRKELI